MRVRHQSDVCVDVRRRNIPIGLSVIGKKIFYSKAWRRIIQFGLSATSAIKGMRRNIPVGLTIVRQELQHSIYPAGA
jgi:hypothetical protein